MKVQDARRVREAADAFATAVAELDPAALSLADCTELWALGDQLEALSRAIASRAAALSVVRASDDDRPDRLSPPLRRVEP